MLRFMKTPFFLNETVTSESSDQRLIDRSSWRSGICLFLPFIHFLGRSRTWLTFATFIR